MDRKHFVKVGRTQVELPPGVTTADWALERSKVQNPRIRSYLGCIRITEDVLDSNYAILHCSPVRLFKIWQQVRKVCRLIRSEIGPTLKEPSIFPELDAALRSAAVAFDELARTVIDDVERYSDHLAADEAPELSPELEREFPGPQLSTSVTSAPSR